MLKKENINGFLVDSLNKESCCDELLNAIKYGNKTSWIACFNPHSYNVTKTDTKFAEALHKADWLIADGIGIVLASYIKGGHIKQRVTGSDIFDGLHKRMNNHGGMKVFFLGSSNTTLSKIKNRFLKDFPNIELSGIYSPPFKLKFSPDEIDEMISVINKAKPDVLWVAMTAPKQEKWIYENLQRIDVKLVGAVGAVFDFYSGEVKRSHFIFQRFGLEWLPRLLQQPFRLWRRMFISAPVFIWDTFKHLFTR